jgi:hypothetical protein
MTTALQPILVRISAIEAKQHNAHSYEDNDVLIPPMQGDQPPPAEAPTTVAALYALSAASLNQLETYYGLPHTDTLQVRRRRLARAYGVLFAVKTSIEIRR